MSPSSGNLINRPLLCNHPCTLVKVSLILVGTQDWMNNIGSDAISWKFEKQTIITKITMEYV